MAWLDEMRKKDKARKDSAKLAIGLDTPSGNPVGQWIQGVAQRTLHPLETLANEANRWRNMPSGELAGNLISGDGANLASLVGMMAGRGAKTADLARLALAEKLKAKGVPDEVIWKQTGWTLDTPAKTEFELAHELAQRNAALPIEQGGLGLPPNNTAMDRAKAMGFDTPAYHGTASDVDVLNPSVYGSSTGAKSAKDAFWAAQNPETAVGYSHYAANSAPVRKLVEQANEYERLAQRGNNAVVNWAKYDDALRRAEELEQSIFENSLRGQNVMPLMVRTQKANSIDAGSGSFVDLEGGVNELLKKTQRQGKDVAIIRNLDDDAGFSNRPTDHYGIINPSAVRSRFAAFDPMQRNSANLLAGGIGGAIGLSTLSDLLNREEYQ